MEKIEREKVVIALRKYCERYEGQNKASASLKGVSSATVSQMLNGNWELIKDEMWRNVSSQIGYKGDKWQAVETVNFRTITALLKEAQENALVMAVIGRAGSGKTFALKHYTDNNKKVYLLRCNNHWKMKQFLSEILSALGRESAGRTECEMMQEAVRYLKMQPNPLLILDEADKLKDYVLCSLITLYNELEDECGIVLCATGYLETRLTRGNPKKQGYEELWSRIGRKCIELKGVTASDITRICEMNGIVEKKTIDLVLGDSEGDLRRVKRKVYAEVKKRATNGTN